jgi:DNA mismatch repair protein MutS
MTIGVAWRLKPCLSQRIATDVPEATDAATTPLMAQHPMAPASGCAVSTAWAIYGLLFADAEKAAAALSIVLTTRGTHRASDQDAALIHAAEGYLNRLIRQGLQGRGLRAGGRPGGSQEARQQSVVRRDVVRVVTPGTLTEDGLPDAASHNHLCALADAVGTLGLAWSTSRPASSAARRSSAAAPPAALARSTD